jgi:hypothetical protein
VVRNNYTSGDWNIVCDVCDKKIKASESRKRWDGLIVCQDDFEYRHPQDFIKSKQDKIYVPYVRKEVDDQFVFPTTWWETYYGFGEVLFPANRVERLSTTEFDLPNTDYTLGGWVYFNKQDFSDPDGIIHTMDDYGSASWEIFRVNEYIRVYLYEPPFQTALNSASGTTILVPNRWYYVSLVRSGTTVSLYIDGILQDSQVSTLVPGTSGLLTVGEDFDSGIDLDGKLQDWVLTRGSAITTVPTRMDY